MGLVISVKTDVDKVVGQLTDKLRRSVPRFASNSINRAIRTVRTRTNRGIREKYNLTLRDVEEELSTVYSTPQTLTAKLIATGGPISLRKFGATVSIRNVLVRGHVVKRQVVSARILKTAPKKVIKGAFTLRNVRGPAQTPIFRRLTRARFPIAKQQIKSLPKMFVEDKIKAVQEQVSREVFLEDFFARLDREISASK